MAISIKTPYISIGANRSSSCSACSSNGTVAYGAGKFLALWNTEDKRSTGVYATLPGHKGEVTKVKLFKGSREEETAFVSGDTEGQIRIWSQNGQSYECTISFDAHKGQSISALASVSSGPFEGYLFTGSSDGSVKLWHISGDKAELKQTVDLKARLPLDLEVSYLPNSQSLVLVIGCTDRQIQVWTEKDGQFQKAITLEGHEDWVKCLSITPYPSSSPNSPTSSNDLMLASGSQDNYTRLWRISPVSSTPHGSGLDLLDEFESRLGESSNLSTKAHSLYSKEGTKYNVTLEALLMGHESGLTNLHWSPDPNPLLLSTSMDNSMVIWSPSSEGIWVPEHRFGAMTGRALGLFGALWGQNGESVLCSGWNGGWERWVRKDDGEWDVRPGVTGHFESVQSVAWDENGDYFVSASSDQTSRIHSAVVTDPDEAGPSSRTWAEIARPQIHGYDMTDVAFITPLRFVSTADEKVARVFDAPGGFVESLGSLGISSTVTDSSSRPKGATVPPLGLSNRALGKEAATLDHPTPHVSYTEREAVSRTLTAQPTEEELSMSTLWPEVEKVYGHGYELEAVAASHDGSLIATSCRASNSEHAVVRSNSTSSWDAVGAPLAGHTLTITRILFSPDDDLILTVSRDRGWRLFKRDPQNLGYVPFAQEEKAHSRMILDAAWSSDGKAFITVSRDKSIKVWTLTENGATAAATVKLAEGITAVDWRDEHIVLGTESGSLHLFKVHSEDKEPAHLYTIPPSISHNGPVNRLQWCPGKKNLLASCSDDKSVRLFEIHM